MPRPSRPRLVLVVALAVTVAGVVGVSVAGSTLVHLISVAGVELGLLASVVMVLSIAGDDVERLPPEHPRRGDPRDPRDDPGPGPTAPQPPRV